MLRQRKAKPRAAMEKLSGDLISKVMAAHGDEMLRRSLVKRCDAEDPQGTDWHSNGREMRSKERKIRKETKI